MQLAIVNFHPQCSSTLGDRRADSGHAIDAQDPSRKPWAVRARAGGRAPSFGRIFTFEIHGLGRLPTVSEAAHR